MDGWFDGHPTKRKTRQGIRRFINSWLSKEQDKGGTKHDSVSTTPPPPPKPKLSRRMCVRLLDYLHMEQMGVLYEDGEIKARGEFRYARVNGDDLYIKGDETTKRWEDAKCDPGTQLSDFFP
jgi:hypothetical protein